MTNNAHLYIEVPAEELDRASRILQNAGFSPTVTFLPENTTPYGIFTGRDLQFLINRINEYLTEKEHPERIAAKHTNVPLSAQAHLLRIATTSISWSRSFHQLATTPNRLRLSRITSLDIEELAAFFQAHPKLRTAPRTEAAPPCNYCRAAPARTRLADALMSGRYQQAERPGLLSLLRDERDRYSISGVATAELTNSVWVRKKPDWQVYPQDEFNRVFPEFAESQKEFPHQVRHFLKQLENALGRGNSTGINPDTARALGLAENTEVLWCSTTNMTAAQKQAAQIPENWHDPYILDAFTYELAAELLREDPWFLQWPWHSHN